MIRFQSSRWRLLVLMVLAAGTVIALHATPVMTGETAKASASTTPPEASGTREASTPVRDAPAAPDAARSSDAATRSGEGILPSSAPAGSVSPGSIALSPMMAAIQAALAEGRARVEGLSRRFTSARHVTTARAIEREISQVKSDTELRLLRIQADFARREGRTDAAARIEAAIAQRQAPPPAPQPQNRPAPPAAATSR